MAHGLKNSRKWLAFFLGACIFALLAWQLSKNSGSEESKSTEQAREALPIVQVTQARLSGSEEELLKQAVKPSVSVQATSLHVSFLAPCELQATATALDATTVSVELEEPEACEGKARGYRVSVSFEDQRLIQGVLFTVEVPGAKNISVRA